MRARRLLRFLAPVALALVLPAAAEALTLVDSPQQPSGPFRHNLFHSADSSGGASGDVLAWFDLDTGFGAANFLDPATGDLEAHFDLFADSTLTTAIGTAFASGSVDVAELSDAGEADVIVGTLEFDFDLGAAPASALAMHLEASFGPEADDVWEDIALSFADVQYATSSDGRTANTFDDTDLVLWGADGTFSGSSRLGGPGGLGGFGSTSSVGVDLVVTVPEPGPAALLGVALAALRSATRRP